MKRCTVAFALPGRQWLWEVELDDAGTVADALERARMQAGAAEVPWDAAVGIFGMLCERNAVPRDGDRIEVYRPLRADPKVTRRARVAAGRAARDRAARSPRSRSES
jgi:uncharacterized protein